MGRPSYEPTEAVRKRVRKCAGTGVPHDDIARLLGIDKKTLYKHLSEELSVGKAEAHEVVTGMLFEKVLKGDIAAIIFWCKSQLGWNERPQLNPDQEKPITIIIESGPEPDRRPRE